VPAEGPAHLDREHLTEAMAALQNIYGQSFQPDDEFVTAFQGLLSREPMTIVRDQTQAEDTNNAAGEMIASFTFL